MTPLIETRNGIRIEIHNREHLPTHIHAKYGEYEALINIRTGELFKGKLPIKKLRLVQDWLKEGNKRSTVENNFYELNPHLAPSDWTDTKVE
jgi:hypothetical protein